MSIWSPILATTSATLVLERKLPDDLTLLEYSELTGALESVCSVAGRIAGAPTKATILRAQYGSDFMLIIAVPNAIAGALYILCQAVNKLAQASLASASAEREQADQDRSAAEAKLRNAEEERTQAEARKLRAEASILELDHDRRIEEMRRRTSDASLRGAVAWELAQGGALRGTGIFMPPQWRQVQGVKASSLSRMTATKLPSRILLARSQ